MTACLSFTLEAVRVRTKAGATKKEAFLLGEITERREGERVIRG